MIIDKHKPEETTVKVSSPEPETTPPSKEEVDNNPLIEVYEAAKRILSAIPSDSKDSSSPYLFKTVKLDLGQFERIVRGSENEEYAVEFPAVFIRFVNVRYLVQQQRIGEGRATMRIRFILNNLNNSDDVVETDGFRVFQLINDAIQSAKDSEPALNERTNLTYFDMPESQDNGLQPYWIDYEIWFRTSSSFQYKNWVERYLVMPPFTNHSDAPEHDTEGHGDHKIPTDRDSIHIEPSVEHPDGPIEPEDN